MTRVLKQYDIDDKKALEYLTKMLAFKIAEGIYNDSVNEQQALALDKECQEFLTESWQPYRQVILEVLEETKK